MKKGTKLKSALAREPGTVRVSPGVYRRPSTQGPAMQSPTSQVSPEQAQQMFQQYQQKAADASAEKAYRVQEDYQRQSPVITPEMNQRAAAELAQMQQSGREPIRTNWYADAWHQLQQARERGYAPMPIRQPSQQYPGLEQLPPPMPRPQTPGQGFDLQNVPGPQQRLPQQFSWEQFAAMYPGRKPTPL